MREDPRPKHPLVRAADRGPEESFSHPLNPRSEVHGHSLSDASGLERVGVHLVRVPAGKESFLLHAHHGEEEFLFILSGRGILELEREEHEIGPGDFVGFPTPSVAHHLRNPGPDDLVYLSGGERHPMEIADFPRLGKRMLRVGRKVSIVALDGEALGPFPKL